MIRILIVDDQALFREGLRTVLSCDDDLEVVGEAGDGQQAIALAASLQPDVILMDLRMPILDGVEAIRRLRGKARVLALTTFDDDESLFEALRAGALGYVLKDVSPTLLVEAVRATARGESFLQPKVATRVLNALAQRPPPSPAQDLGLSAREIEVLRGIARGRSNKEIAAALDITEGTVKNHVTSILGKLGVSDRTQAALKARDLGVV